MLILSYPDRYDPISLKKYPAKRFVLKGRSLDELNREIEKIAFVEGMNGL